MCAKIVTVLAVCHRDTVAAARWMKWASFLSTHHNMTDHELIVFYTHRAEPEIDKIKDATVNHGAFFHTRYVKCPDENEVGYPMSANHIFLRALEYTEEIYPGHPTLFVEPDCIPIAPDWLDQIEDEYEYGAKEFMGFRVGGGHPHMTGNAVYGPRWRTKAPSITTVLERKDSGGMFPKGKGFPFDLWIADDVLKDFHSCTTIFQQWAPGMWTKKNVDRIPKWARLVHQDKEGSLMATIARRDFPEFIDLLPKPTTYFMLTAPTHKLDVGGQAFEFTPCSRPWSVFQPKTPDEEMTLLSVAGKLGVLQVTKEDYLNLLSQRR